MSKPVWKCHPTALAPNAKRFTQTRPADAAAAKRRLRAMAERLKGTGPNLADAHSNSNPNRSE